MDPTRDARDRPMTTTTPIETAEAGLAEILRGFRLRVEKALAGYLPPEDDPSAACPPRLAQAMRYSLMGGGKRLRPVLWS